MKSKPLSRVLSLLLAATLLIQMLPVQTFAVQDDSADIAEQAEATAPVTILNEEISLRGEAEKHFRLSDGSFLAVTYSTPVHYMDSTGDWQDIDNRPIMAADADGAASYQFANADKATSFSSGLTDGTIFTTSVGELSVSMQLLDTIQAAEKLSTSELSADDTASLVTNITKDDLLVYSRDTVAALEEKTELYTADETQQDWQIEDLVPQHINSSIVYEDVFPGVDIRYTANSYNIKEEIIINQPQSSYRYDFLLALEGLTAQLNDSGSVSLLNTDGEVIYEIPAPYMYDATGEYSNAVGYAIKEVEDGVIFTVIADKEWIDDNSREYPVIIDPTLNLAVYGSNNDSTTSLLMTYVKESEPTRTSQGTCELYIGYGINALELRGYIYVNNLPDIPTGSIVTRATLNMYMGSYSTSTLPEMPIGIYKVTSECPADKTYQDWIRYMTWNTRASYGSDLIDYVTASANTLYYANNHGAMSWDMTELVKEWYSNNTQNRTITLGTTTQYTSSKCAVGVFQAYNTNTTPALIVSYRNNTGIEPYYTYTTLGAGNAGTAYIADATGQVKISNNVLGYSSTINPFSLNLFYNSDYFSAEQTSSYNPLGALGLNMTVGAGWRLDCVQKIEEETISSTQYLKYYDGDGSIHYFLKRPGYYDDYFYDEDGLGLKIKRTATNAYEMSDDYGNTWKFRDNFLVEAINESGHIIQINYSDNKLTTIVQRNKDSNNNYQETEVATFDYDNGGNTLKTITDAAGNIYTLSYSGSRLASIKRTDPTSQESKTLATYVYASYKVTSMTDTESDYRLEFSYYGSSDEDKDPNRRVSTVQEIGKNAQGADVYGAKLTIAYLNDSQTVYTYHGTNNNSDPKDDILTHYLFDYAGRTVNAYTTDKDGKILGASNAVYSGTGSTDKRNNRTLRTATIGVASQHLLENPSFEKSSDWTLSGASIVEDESVSSRHSRTGKFALSLGQGNAQASVGLSNSVTYTFSAYVDTSAVSDFSGRGVYLKVSGAGQPCEGIPVNYQTSTDDKWTRISVTFTAPTDGTYTFSICTDGVSGTVYVDDVQLETGEAPSNYNLLENGSFSMGKECWETPNTSTVENGALTFVGSPSDATTYASQTVQINLPSTETYVLSGWVTANAVPDTENKHSDPAQDTNKQCGLRAAIHYADGSVEYHYAPFNTDLITKQFVSYTIVPNPKDANGNPVVKTVDHIVVTCAYETNANTATFDDISLVREVTQTMEYDEDGNLRSVTTSDLNVDINTYNGGNLIKTVTGSEGIYTYTYDNTYKHRLTSVKNQASENSQTEWITQSMQYDSYGNVIETKLTGPGSRSMWTSAVYASKGNLLQSVTDATGATVTYGYTNENNESDGNSIMWGLPTTVTAPNGTTTRTAYDLYGRVTQTSVVNLATLEYNYSKGNLSSIIRKHSVNGSTKTQGYFFEYDDFGNTKSIKVGQQPQDNQEPKPRTLVTNTYDADSGLLEKQTYGNGHTVTFEYDNLGRTKKVIYSNGPTLTYAYTGDGQLHSVTETNGNNSTVYLYRYDSLGNLVGSEKLTNNSLVLRTNHSYDNDNRLSSQGWQMGSDSYSETYEYDTWDGKLSNIHSASGQLLTYEYDDLRRLSQLDTGLYEKSYDYRNIDNNRTTGQVASVTYELREHNQILESTVVDSTLPLLADQTFAYTYDSMGNIATYTDDNGAVTYTYDGQGQLKKAVHGTATWEYEYDDVGNIRSSEEPIFDTSGNITSTATHTYSYDDDGVWGDMLIAYDGQSILYDPIGNPTSYYNGTRWTFSWQQGRQLSKAENASFEIDYTYDADGLRTSKTVKSPLDTTQKNGVYVDSDGETRFYVNGSATYAKLVYWDGYFYYFNSSKKAVRNTDYYVTYSNDLIPCATYHFDANGRITNPPFVGVNANGDLKDGIYTDSDGEVRCYVDGVATYAGLVYADGYYYYFNSSLKAIRNQTYWISNPNGLMVAGDYTFDSYGRMVNPPAGALTEAVSTFALTEPTMSKTYNYVYASGKLLRQNLTVSIDNGVANYTLDFFYDASGIPFALKYNGDMCYYITNLQGDVMYIVDGVGHELASYQYDPYGKVISATGALAEINPLRYRGYVYDTETKFYYLQSRYYDPELGRFINADAYTSTGQGILGNNMFAYCLNNPVVLADSSGTAAHIGFSADGQIHDAPWRIGSPGGGGWSQDIHYSQQDYGSVADKFYTVRAYKWTQSLINRSREIKTLSSQREEEFYHRQIAIYSAVFFSIIDEYAPDTISLLDNIIGEIGLGLTALGALSYFGVIVLSPTVTTFTVCAGIVCTTWDYGRKICSFAKRMYKEVTNNE